MSVDIREDLRIAEEIQKKIDQAVRIRNTLMNRKIALLDEWKSTPDSQKERKLEEWKQRYERVCARELHVFELYEKGLASGAEWIEGVIEKLQADEAIREHFKEEQKNFLRLKFGFLHFKRRIEKYKKRHMKEDKLLRKDTISVDKLKQIIGEEISSDIYALELHQREVAKYDSLMRKYAKIANVRASFSLHRKIFFMNAAWIALMSRSAYNAFQRGNNPEIVLSIVGLVAFSTFLSLTQVGLNKVRLKHAQEAIEGV